MAIEEYKNTPLYDRSIAKISSKFGIPLRTVYSWCSGERIPADYVIAMMLNIILLERRLSDGKQKEGLEKGMGSSKQGIKEAGQKS